MGSASLRHAGRCARRLSNRSPSRGLSRGNPPQGNARPRNVLPMWATFTMVAPMVAKLSREFYDRFGDKLTDELVNCLNSIEASYRAEIKDLFAAHFGRFEEKFERRTAETAAHFARFEEKFEHRLAATKAELRQEVAGLRVEIHSVKADLIKWTFVFWAPVALAVIGLYFKT